MSSANPPYMTTLVFPNADRPAVRAKGTVRPSDNPIVASEITRASTLKPFLEFIFSALESVLCDSTSPFSESIEAVCCTPVAGCAVSNGSERLDDRSRPCEDTFGQPRLGKHGDKEMLSIPISREDFVRTGTGVIVCRKNRFFNPTKDMTLIGFGSGRRLRTPEREAVLN